KEVSLFPTRSATPAAAAVPRLRSRRRPEPVSESVALIPICQTRRPSAKTGVARGVPRTILVGRRTDEIVRADRPGRAEGAAGVSARRLCCEFGHRGNRAATVARATSSSCPAVAFSGHHSLLCCLDRATAPLVRFD